MILKKAKPLSAQVAWGMRVGLMRLQGRLTLLHMQQADDGKTRSRDLGLQVLWGGCLSSALEQNPWHAVCGSEVVGALMLGGPCLTMHRFQRPYEGADACCFVCQHLPSLQQ